MNKAEFLVVVVITLIVVAIWGASQYIYSKDAAIPNPDAKKYLDPVDPNFDQKTLDKISSLPTATPSASTSPKPLASPTPTPKAASPSATPKGSSTPSPKPSATPRPSGSLTP